MVDIYLDDEGKKRITMGYKYYTGLVGFTDEHEEEMGEILDQLETRPESIFAAIVSVGMKYFEIFDMDELCENLELRQDKLALYIQILFSNNLLPIKMEKEYFDKNIKKIEEDVETRQKKVKIADSEPFITLNNDRRKRIKILQDTIDRANKWVEKGWIILE